MFIFIFSFFFSSASIKTKAHQSKNCSKRLVIWSTSIWSVPFLVYLKIWVQVKTAPHPPRTLSMVPPMVRRQDICGEARKIPKTWLKIWTILGIQNFFWASKILLEFFRIFGLTILKNITFRDCFKCKILLNNCHNHISKFCVWSDLEIFLRMSLYWDT